jgi:hypothetical protein
MFSEAEQSQLQSFLNELETIDTDNSSRSPVNAWYQKDKPPLIDKKHKDKKKMTPYSKKRSPSTESSASKSGRARKPAHELLSENQKKANHIASEQKRRANIKIGFDQLVSMVPTLDSCHRSESLILQKCMSFFTTHKVKLTLHYSGRLYS